MPVSVSVPTFETDSRFYLFWFWFFIALLEIRANHKFHTFHSPCNVGLSAQRLLPRAPTIDAVMVEVCFHARKQWVAYHLRIPIKIRTLRWSKCKFRFNMFVEQLARHDTAPYSTFYFTFAIDRSFFNFTISVQRKNALFLALSNRGDFHYEMMCSNLPECGFQWFHLKYHRIDNRAVFGAWVSTRICRKTDEPFQRRALMMRVRVCISIMFSQEPWNQVMRYFYLPNKSLFPTHIEFETI